MYQRLFENYGIVNRKIEPINWKLFADLCEEQITAHMNPNEVKLRKRHRKIQIEIDSLRKKIQQTVGKNLVLTNREIRLLKYIDLTDEETGKLKSNVKIAKKLEKMERKGHDENASSDEEDDDEKTDDHSSTNSHSSETSKSSQSGKKIFFINPSKN